MMKDTLVLAFVNPRSGGADPPAVEHALRRRFPSLELALTPEGGDLVGFMRGVVQRVQPALVVVSGGDGTVAAAATAIGSSPARLGILPSGTANVLAQELGIPPGLEDACDVLVEGTPHALDVIEYGARWCLVRVAVGIFGEVAEGTSTAAKRVAGSLAYLFSAVPLLAQTEPKQFELEVDGERTTPQGSCIIVTNVGGIGGVGLRWGEQVRADDGRLDVFVVHSHTLPDNLEVLWNMIGGDIGGSREVSHLVATREVRIVASEALAVVADGEPSRARELRLRCVPGAIAVMGPRALEPARDGGVGGSGVAAT